MSPSLGDVGYGLLVANENGLGSGLALDKDRVESQNTLPNGTNLLPYSASQRVFSHELLGSAMGSSTRSSDVGNRQESAYEVCQPIIGVGDVVEEDEIPLFVQTAGFEIGPDLP